MSAARVVVCAGAIETPRLLRCSGLGNTHVGRHLHSHTIHLRLGWPLEPIASFRGPGHSIATLDFVHAGDAPYGGGVLFDAPSMLPLAAAHTASLFGVPSWGADAQDMDARRAPARGRNDGDRAGDPPRRHRDLRQPRGGGPLGNARRPGPSSAPPGSDAVLDFLGQRCREWLRAADTAPGPVVLTGTALAEHAAGSCRMGDDPAAAACDRDGRVHGTQRVYVCDASLHPSNGSVNPALTVMANAYRVADAMLAEA